MNDSTPPNGRKQPPVVLYAIIIGGAVIAALVIGSIVGQHSENPQPSGASSPMATAATATPFRVPGAPANGSGAGTI